MEPRKNFAILKSSREALKPRLSHLRKQPEPRKKLKSSRLQLLTHPLPPSPTKQSTHAHDSDGVKSRFERKRQSRTTQSKGLHPSLSLKRVDTPPPTSPHAIIRVRLVVFHAHIILLGGRGAFLWSPRIPPWQHVLGHMEGWTQRDACQRDTVL